MGLGDGTGLTDYGIEHRVVDVGRGLTCQTRADDLDGVLISDDMMEDEFGSPPTTVIDQRLESYRCLAERVDFDIGQECRHAVHVRHGYGQFAYVLDLELKSAVMVAESHAQTRLASEQQRPSRLERRQVFHAFSDTPTSSAAGRRFADEVVEQMHFLRWHAGRTE
ncbi:hypothetical protein BFL35_10425 [Clavibacter michiganensis]|nr:hypothetical protein BFL35_10425 [Clavibacter michiganensis]